MSKVSTESQEKMNDQDAKNNNKSQNKIGNGYNIRAQSVTQDQNASYNKMLKECPVAQNSDMKSHTIFKHADVMQIITNNETFSSEASPYISVPHGLDEPKHSLYRNAIASAFTDEKMLPLLPRYREIAAALIDKMIKTGQYLVDAQNFAFYYAARIQLALLNWNLDLDEACVEWTKANLKSSLEENQEENIANAKAWNELVYSQLNNRREAISKGLRKNTPDDVTDDLLNIRINGSALTDEEISSLIRNLNMGLVSSLACNIGNSIYFFATNKDIQHEVRSDINRLPEALDEITRLNGALVQSKRLVKQSTQIGGVTLKSGETVNVNWCSANLDEDVFEQPNTFLWGRDHSKHLMYGLMVKVS